MPSRKEYGKLVARLQILDLVIYSYLVMDMGTWKEGNELWDFSLGIVREVLDLRI